MKPVDVAKELGLSGVSVLDCEHRTPRAVERGFPYIAIPDIVDGRVMVHSTRKISELDLVNWTRRTTPQQGDVLVTRRGRVGDTAVIPGVLRCAIGQNLVLLRSNEREVRQDFLRWAARSPRWWSEVDRLRNVGAIFSSLNVKDIARIKIPILPLDQQRAVAEVLGALENKIVANGEVVGTADALAASITRSFVDPSRWVTLEEIALTTMGSSPPGTSYNEAGDGVVFYQGVRDFGFRHPVNRVWTTKPVRMANAGDCLLSVRAPVGQLNLASEDNCIGRGLASVRSLDSRPMTLFHVLRDSAEAWARYEAEGTVFGSINKSHLEALTLPAIRTGAAVILERKLSALETQIASCLKENLVLAAIRDALLPQLMSGKLRVKDAERIADEAL